MLRVTNTYEDDNLCVDKLADGSIKINYGFKHLSNKILIDAAKIPTIKQLLKSRLISK